MHNPERCTDHAMVLKTLWQKKVLWDSGHWWILCSWYMHPFTVHPEEVIHHPACIRPAVGEMNLFYIASKQTTKFNLMVHRLLVA